MPRFFFSLGRGDSLDYKSVNHFIFRIGPGVGVGVDQEIGVGAGGGTSPPRLRTPACRIYKIQTAFDRSGEFVDGNLMLLTSRSLMTSQVRSKSKCLTILSIWIYRALKPYEMEIRQYNDKDSVWDTSKHHPKLWVSIFKVKAIQGHNVKERSN